MKPRRSHFQLAVFGAAFVLLLAGALLLANNLKRRRAENPPLASDATTPQPISEYQALIQKLSSANESERKTAEQELSNAGALAEADLKAAEAAATGPAKDAIQRLRNRSRFSGLKNLDYSKAFPANSVVAVNARNVQETLDKAKTTALGKLIQRPAFDFFRADLLRRLQRENTGGLPVEYFKGQIAVAAFPAAPGKFEKVAKFGVLLELRGADPLGEYLELSRTLLKAGGSIATYKDIECIESGPGNGAYARTGSNVVLGIDPQTLHILIDTILTGPAIGANEDVQKIRAAQTKEPDLLVLIDMPSVLHQILLYEVAGKAGENALVSVLAAKLGYASLSSRVAGDGFEDRVIWLMPEGPISIVSALTAPAGAPAPLDLFDSIPAHAVAAAVGHLDGAKLESALNDFWSDLKKLGGVANEPNPFDLLRWLEQQLSLKPGELLALFKGEAGVWLLPKTGADWDSPDLCGALTAPDERSAEAMANVLDRLNSGQPPGVFSKTTHNKRVLRIVNAPRAGDTGPSLNNYAVDGKRLYLASSAQALKNQLDHLDRHTTSLLRRDPLQKALAEFSADERRGSVIYLDSQAILTQLAEQKFLPSLQADPATPREVKDALAQLPPPVDLFRDAPPLLALTVRRKDRAEWVIRGPLPIVPIAAAAILFAGSQKADGAPKPKEK